MKSYIKRSLKKLKNKYNAFIRPEKNVFYRKHRKLRNVEKIIYALTPPPKLSNVGDQAQVVAIYKWIKANYPDKPIIEVDKDECISMINPLKKLVKKTDLILIHSGGNLGDRGRWSETGRRNIIASFPENKIVSLPQTIFFSNTETGNKEKNISVEIYNKHKNLTVIGRDEESGQLAKTLFSNSKTFCIPDFVLYLKADDLVSAESKQKPKNGILFCLRKDDESALNEEQQQIIISRLAEDGNYETFDTTIPQKIYPAEREKFLKETLEYFNTFEMIVTDRYHGLIFAALLQKRTIVLPTVDHKLTSAFDWFKEIPYIKFLQLDKIDKIAEVQKELKETETSFKKDWQGLYFNDLRNRV